MRIFIDTNILFSTVLNPDSTPAKAYFKAVTKSIDEIVANITPTAEIVTYIKPVYNFKADK